MLGTGYAVTELVSCLRSLVSTSIATVGFESVGFELVERATNFAAKHSIAKSFGTWDESNQSDSVDIVYVGAIAPLRRELCLRSIDAGKAVRCENTFCDVKRRLIRSGKSLRSAFQSNGNQYQTIEVMRCLDRDQRQSNIMPLSPTITIMRIVDAALIHA